jgi:ATP-dependent Clp protease ATP-binding subunit ClpC
MGIGSFIAENLGKVLGFFGFVLVLGFLGKFAASGIRKRKATINEPSQPPPPPPAESAAQNIKNLYKLTPIVERVIESAAQPTDLLENPYFQQGVGLLKGPGFSVEDVIEYGVGENYTIACMAYGALEEKPTGPEDIDKIILNAGSSYAWPLFFLLRVLMKKAEKPVVGPVLSQAQDWWTQYKATASMMNNFIRERISSGEQIEFKSEAAHISPKQLQLIETFLKQLDPVICKPVLESFEQLQRTYIDEDYLNSIGRIWRKENHDELIVEHSHFGDTLQEIDESLFQARPRSLLLVGESGVGKSTLVESFAEHLVEKGWKLFEASANDVLAGQIYIGSLEGRVQKLVKNLDRSRSIIWFVPNFHELFFAGQHQRSPTGILHMLLPFLESGKLLIIGETRPRELDFLLQQSRQLSVLMRIIRIEPLQDNESLNLVKKWLDNLRDDKDPDPLISDDVLGEAFQLSRQFLYEKAAPGNLFHFVKRTLQQCIVQGRIEGPVSIDSFYTALSSLTGLPRSILDEKAGFNLDGLKKHFSSRVLGQNEAVDCLVERLAMIKAGLTDPTRPLGVFLFAGPTGTGKTEIAKTLAEYLFGSAERMIRLDMSEMKTPESLDRIIGGRSDTGRTTALVNEIRNQPFSVILLDEFEKAHPNIWDLFLQVFDDGRLTDRQGNTANFRHSIIILTSNLGATIGTGMSIGFSSNLQSFSRFGVEKAISQTFRREFINRIDRIVIFLPLSRDIMRGILEKEIADVLSRRGLRNREWALEWEDSAIDFLFEKGFTLDLGARPLKRAIERYFLTPLSLSIVNYQFPEGDQFLFVRSNGEQIQVEFIDPDAPFEEKEAFTGDEDQAEAETIEKREPSLRAIVSRAHGSREEFLMLTSMFAELEKNLSSRAWQDRREYLLQQTNINGFWSSPDRFNVLSDIEYIDRMETAFKSTTSLLQRLKKMQNSNRTQFPVSLISNLGQKIYLLQEALSCLEKQTPKDCFLLLETRNKSPDTTDSTLLFARRLHMMYRKWIQKRRMRSVHLLEQEEAGEGSFRAVLAISGFGAFSILAGETGLHIYEIPKDAKSFTRCTVFVRVVPQPEEPVSKVPELLKHAEKLLSVPISGAPGVVRRYREKPSPLIRDSVRGWRSGRIEAVFGGDFDTLV